MSCTNEVDQSKKRRRTRSDCKKKTSVYKKCRFIPLSNNGSGHESHTSWSYSEATDSTRANRMSTLPSSCPNTARAKPFFKSLKKEVVKSLKTWSSSNTHSSPSSSFGIFTKPTTSCRFVPTRPSSPYNRPSTHSPIWSMRSITEALVPSSPPTSSSPPLVPCGWHVFNGVSRPSKPSHETRASTRTHSDS